MASGVLIRGWRKRTMKKAFTTFLLGAALLIPVATARADDDDHKRRDRDHRYYDPYRHDYHAWDSREDQAYRQYLQERNREYRDYNRASKREQRDYWKWRHQHSDNDADRHTR